VSDTGTRGDCILLGRTTAGMVLLARTGVGEVELAYDDDLEEAGEKIIRWWCGGNWDGQRRFSERFPYPAQAVEDLLARVVNGGHCKRCGRTTIVGAKVPRLCCFVLHADDVDDVDSYRYLRSCESNLGPSRSERRASARRRKGRRS